MHKIITLRNHAYSLVLACIFIYPGINHMSSDYKGPVTLRVRPVAEHLDQNGRRPPKTIGDHGHKKYVAVTLIVVED